MPSWKKVIVSGSDAHLNSLNVNELTSSGLINGTSSYAVTASYAYTSSYTLLTVTSSVSASYSTYAETASLSSTASYVLPLNQDVIVTGSLTTTGTGSFGLAIIGDGNDGSYRLVIGTNPSNEPGALLVEKKVSGSWIYVGDFNDV